MLQESNSSGPNFCPTSPLKTLSSLTKHRDSTLLQISKRKRETLLQEKRLQNLDKFLNFVEEDITKSCFTCSIEEINCTDLRGFLEQDRESSMEKVLKILVHLIAGEKSQAKEILKETGESLQNFFGFIGDDKIEDLRKEACLTLSEIVLKNEKASQILVDDEEYLMKILRFVKEDFIEGVRILVNLTKDVNFRRITKLVEHGVLDCFVEILDEDDVENVELGLEGIENVLECGEIMANCQGEARNMFREELEVNGGVGKIEDLTWSENEEIHRKAERILDEFFTEEEEEFYHYDEISMENE